MTEEQLLNTSLHVDERGNLYAVPYVGTDFDLSNPQHATDFLASMRYVAHINSIDPEWRNLMSAAQVLFKTLFEHQLMLEALVHIAEDSGNDEMAIALTSHMTANQLARRCAIEGTEILLPNSK